MASKNPGGIESLLDYRFRIAIADGVAEALKGIDPGDIDKATTNKLKKLSSKATQYRQIQRDANESIAAKMRVAVVRRFDREKEEHRQFRDPDPYGRNRGRGSHALRSALAGKATAEGTYDGIAFMNSPQLYEAAKFWRRLNFGSGRGEVGLPPISFTAFGLHFTLPPFMEPKGEPNTMPPGLWFIDPTSRIVATGRASSDVFAPIRRFGTTQRRVKDIQAWSFFDAGIQEFNEVAGVEYSHMVNRIVERLNKE
jgi:hypothetical protein